jgi:hypothetical protein
MNGRGRRTAIAIAIACLAANGLFCEGQKASLADKRQTVRIGFTRLAESNLSADQKTLADTIPLRLMDVLAALDARTISAEEAQAYRSASLTAKITEIGLSLDQGIANYDLKILSEKTEAAAQTARQALSPSIKTGREQLKAYRALDLSAVKIEGKKAIEWVKPEQSAKIFPHQLSGPQAFCVSQDLDILVTGTISGSAGYAFLEVYAYHRFLGKRIFSWKTALAEDDSVAAIDEFSGALAKAILGRETTSLLVKANPPKAEVRIDGVYVGNAPYSSPFMPPGKHEILVSSPGFGDMAATVVLEEGKAFEKSFELKSLDLGSLSLTTIPAGANIYVDATKVGQTPIDLPVQGDSRSIRAKEADHVDKIFVVPADSKAPLKIGLITKEDAEKNSFQKQRDRFYWSAGALMLSLPVCVLCVGMASQYDSTVSNINAGSYTDAQLTAAEQQVAVPYYGWRTAAIASGSVSAGLLGYCVYRFVVYLKASQ